MNKSQAWGLAAPTRIFRKAGSCPVREITSDFDVQLTLKHALQGAIRRQFDDDNATIRCKLLAKNGQMGVADVRDLLKIG